MANSRKSLFSVDRATPHWSVGNSPRLTTDATRISNRQVLHGPLFHEEYNDFWPSVGTFAQKGSAAAWLATLFVVIALGLRYSPASSSPERISLAAQWVAAAEKALILADWNGRPQARSVQVVILLAHYWHSVAEIDRVVVWVGAGVRIAQALGLQNSDKAALK